MSGLLLIGCALFYNHFILARPIGSGPAGPAVDRTPFAMPWTDREVRLIGIGDSITAGLGAKSTDHSFFNRLIENPKDEFPEMEGLSQPAILNSRNKQRQRRRSGTSRLPGVRSTDVYQRCRDEFVIECQGNTVFVHRSRVGWIGCAAILQGSMDESIVGDVHG